MGIVDWILLGVIGLVIAAAVFAVYRSKKRGKKCIGCPDSGCCAGCRGCK